MKQIDDLKNLLEQNKIGAYIIPNTDEFQSEYIAPYAARLNFITNFTGSAGTAVITRDRVAFFTDGRYTMQAAQEIDDCFEVYNTSKKSIQEWIQENVDSEIGIDPWLFTIKEVQKYKDFGLKISPIEQNLIDILWGENQPNRPKDKVMVHPMEFAGQSHLEKCKEIGETLQKNKLDRFLITRPDSVSWLLNIRGDDIPYNPVVLSYAAINADGSYDFFVDLEKMDGNSFNHLEAGGRIIDINMLEHHIVPTPECRIGVDNNATPYAIQQILNKIGVTSQHLEDPCQLPKAIKNRTEIRGAQEAHLRDGIALVKFLTWLDSMPLEGELDEYELGQRLCEFRKKNDLFHDLSFDTIAGFAANGAIIHYRAKKDDCATLSRNNLLLLDSGAQYMDGTTDVTRTISLGPPSEEQIEHFTRVLKGHIAVASAKFPKGTTGAGLDTLARNHLWRAGLDYDHGTGHGVGSFLCVHEGPQSISRRSFHTPLEPGMLLSNEPGYYKPGHYGIRIESVVAVKESEFEGFLEFETLTMAPIDLSLINHKMLTYPEKLWLNEYHKNVYKTLEPFLDIDSIEWLLLNTRELR